MVVWTDLIGEGVLPVPPPRLLMPRRFKPESLDLILGKEMSDFFLASSRGWPLSDGICGSERRCGARCDGCGCNDDDGCCGSCCGSGGAASEE